MVLVSALRDRLRQRLALSALTTVESERIDEALFASIARSATDGAPSFAVDYLVGEIFAPVSLTISAHTAGTSVVTLSATPTNARRGDVLEISGQPYLIQDTSPDIDLGANIQDSLAGASATYRYRSFALPSTGPVTQVVDLTNNQHLNFEPGGLGVYGLETGSPRGFDQFYDPDNSVSYITVWPTPSALVRLGVKQTRDLGTLTSSSDIPWPEAALDSLLESALAIWRNWQTGGVSPMEMEASRQGVKDATSAMSQSASPKAPIVRHSHRSRRF